jgi:hypothetical protein
MNRARVQQAIEQIAASIPEANVSDCPEVIGELERLKVMTQLHMLNGSRPLTPKQNALYPDAGQYLSVEEVAKRFHVTPKWLYRHKKQMPHSQPSRKLLLFPEQAITNWFASRKRM